MASSASAGLQEQLEAAVASLQKLQQEVGTATSNRQQLDAQFQENMIVKQELDLVAADSRVYKQIGPILIKQDTAEAKQNVATRLDFISAEMKRLDKVIADGEQTLEKRRAEAMKMQQQLQQQR